MNTQFEYITKRRYHDNGQLQSEFNYKDDKLDGEKKLWYPSGKLASEFNFKDGERDGMCRSYYNTGQIQWEAHYKDGKLDGVVYKWHLQYAGGRVICSEEINYKDGEKEGFHFMWDTDGKLTYEETYIHGYLVLGTVL
tara:strand:+ start:280 stop:693 length:414 start_codon:yes stop_codon:yes gene_type:complete